MKNNNFFHYELTIKNYDLPKKLYKFFLRFWVLEQKNWRIFVVVSKKVMLT